MDSLFGIDGQGAKIDKSAIMNHHYQTQHHDQTQIDSHGIGMPLVKRLVELQNGTMEILSEIGRGTKVVLAFGF